MDISVYIFPNPQQDSVHRTYLDINSRVIALSFFAITPKLVFDTKNHLALYEMTGNNSQHFLEMTGLAKSKRSLTKALILGRTDLVGGREIQTWAVLQGISLQTLCMKVDGHKS